MEELAKEFEAEEKQSERVIQSRKNTAEERTRQRKEWRKRKQEQRIANSANTAESKLPPLNREENDLVPTNPDALTCIPAGKEKPASSSNQFLAPANVKKPRLAALKVGSGEKKIDMASSSRGALMVHMAVGADAVVARKTQKPHQSLTAKQAATANSEYKVQSKELSPENIEYLSKNPVGSGSFGQCFLGRYRGIEVIVKQMTHSETAEDKERARRDLFHEAKIVSALGDHPNLPMLFGVVTKTFPLCLVTQFHGVKEESVTLHKAADANILTMANCITIFQKLCCALGQVHSKGYLHNDIKANNVVLELNSVSEEFNPVLIDFGKSVTASSALLYRRKSKFLKSNGKSYLAPEVVSERLYSVSSDIYSLGRMLKAISSMVGFYQRVREIVKAATTYKCSERLSLDVFSKKIAEVKF